MIALAGVGFSWFTMYRVDRGQDASAPAPSM
jgi:hypothetical protein